MAARREGFQEEISVTNMTIKVIGSSVLLIVLLAAPFFSYTIASPVQYKIHIDPNDLSGFDVEMRFIPATRNVRVAMAAHPEYDARYWRYIENFSAMSGGRNLKARKVEDAVWQIDGATSEVVLRYRLHMP